MLPPTFPIFPLPNAVLFPNVFMPLHIFEPRYRRMVSDALEGDRVIGMVLLKPGFEHDYKGRPPVYGIGCAGLISHAEPLDEGRYNIVLRGLGKFRITSEKPGKPYRVAVAESLPESIAERDREELHHERRRLEALLVSAAEGAEAQLPPALPDEELVNALAQYLAFDPLERQALLEQDGPLARSRALAELLEMKVMTESRHLPSGGVH